MHRKIRTAAVIGSGVMGGGIAALLASAGIPTLLLDIVPFDLSDAEKKDPKARNRLVRAGLQTILTTTPALIMQPKDADLISIGNLEDDFQRIADCDWIVEVVVENLKIKQDLFRRMDGVRRPGTVVSSNTSGIPLKAMSEGLSDDFQRHFLGTHFFNPVRYMHLLEIIPGPRTLPDILAFMADFGERRLGKGIVWAKDTPNFVGNRIGVYGMVKAIQLMVQEGLTIPEVDALLGPAVGRPKTGMFRLCDLVGLDTMGHVAKNTHALVTEDDERDSFVLPDFVQRMIDQKLLGKKVGSGFYKTELTPEWKKIFKVINPETLKYETYEEAGFPCLEAVKKAGTLDEKLKAVTGGNDKGSRYAWLSLATQLNYAAKRIPEISDTLVEIDNAIKWGYNFEMGPFEAWDALGVRDTVERMEKEGITVPDHVRGMLADGHEAFYRTENGRVHYFDFAAGAYRPVAVSDQVISLAGRKGDGGLVKSNASASLVDLGDGVFCVEFHTKMNALNAEIVQFMDEALEWVDANGAGLVIGNEAGGMPGAFSAGADLFQVGTAARAGMFDEIEALIAQMQAVVRKSTYAPFPVVAAPYGLTLGGGCEVCLAADRVVAHAELYMGLVEIGVGLLPAGGGCLNLWKKFLASVPDNVTDLDLAKFFIPCFMNIAMAKVSTSAADARANGFLGPNDRIVFNRDHLIGEAKKEVLTLLENGYAPPARRKIRVFGESAQGMINSELHNMRSAGFVSDHDVLLAKRIAYVMGGGDVRANSEIDEAVIIRLEREAFMEFLHEEKSLARIEHMLKTGKPLRN